MNIYDNKPSVARTATNKMAMKKTADVFIFILE